MIRSLITILLLLSSYCGFVLSALPTIDLTPLADSRGRVNSYVGSAIYGKEGEVIDNINLIEIAKAAYTYMGQTHQMLYEDQSPPSMVSALFIPGEASAAGRIYVSSSIKAIPDYGYDSTKVPHQVADALNSCAERPDARHKTGGSCAEVGVIAYYYQETGDTAPTLHGKDAQIIAYGTKLDQVGVWDPCGGEDSTFPGCSEFLQEMGVTSICRWDGGQALGKRASACPAQSVSPGSSTNTSSTDISSLGKATSTTSLTPSTLSSAGKTSSKKTASTKTALSTVKTSPSMKTSTTKISVTKKSMTKTADFSPKKTSKTTPHPQIRGYLGRLLLF